MTEFTQNIDQYAENCTGDDSAIRVLVLDDEKTLRDLIRQTLTRSGCEVTTAAEGGEGLQALLNKRFDVVVSDLKMEPMDGITFLTEALRIWPWMGVVVFSGYIEDDIRQQATDLGITTILEKPISFIELQKKVVAECRRMQHRIQEKTGVNLNHIQYELSTLREITKAAIEAGSLNEALCSLCDNIGQMLPSIAAGIFTFDNNHKDPALVLSVSESVTDEFMEQMTEDITERFIRLTSGNSNLKLNIESHGPQNSAEGISNPNGIFSAPIVSGNAISGMLAMVPPPGYSYNESDMSFLYHAANHLTTVLMAFQKIREIAVRDNLTGLYNRHHLQEVLESTWNAAKRYGFSAGILIFDIDHFKTVNDNYGHIAGDEVLKELARITTNVCRSSDIIARYGGDEIVIILPNADYSDLSALADRLIKSVREHEFCRSTHKLKSTISVGGAFSRSDDGTMLDAAKVLNNADKALYLSKRNGRDRCSIWNTDSTEKKPENNTKTSHPSSRLQVAENITPKAIIIDDDTSVLEIMKLLLKMEGCEAEGFLNANDTLRYVTENPGRIDIAFVDLNLNGESGLELIQQLHASDDAMVMIVITGDATLDNAVKSMRQGAYDFIQKPIQREQLKMTFARALEYRRLRMENKEYQFHLEDMVRRKSRDLTNALQRTRDSFAFTLRALTTMLDAREQATGRHSQRVQNITELIAKKLGIHGKELEDMRQGALLHDIGKIGIPDKILLKQGSLTDEEWEIMRTHAQIGYDIIKTSPDLKEASEIVGKHHERWNGTGYPNGISGEAIPIGARIFALADTYDAMRANRPYRAGMTAEAAAAEIKRNSGTQFDPEIVDIFLELIPEIEESGTYQQETQPRPPADKSEQNISIDL